MSASDQTGTVVTLKPLIDLYLDDGRAAVMVDEQVLVLSELATTLVLALRDSGPLTHEALTQVLIAEYGDPGDALALTQQAIDDLAASGVVEVAP